MYRSVCLITKSRLAELTFVSLTVSHEVSYYVAARSAPILLFCRGQSLSTSALRLLRNGLSLRIAHSQLKGLSDLIVKLYSKERTRNCSFKPSFYVKL